MSSSVLNPSPPSPPNQTRPTGWKESAPTPSGPKTFAHQPSLPLLPVPSLSDTLTKLKASLKPIARDEREYEDVAKKIDEFDGEGGLGRRLHERLVRRREGGIKDGTRKHWLEEWWDDGGYLMYRDSTVVNVSYYYGFGDHPSHLPQRSLSRAASLIRAAFEYRSDLQSGVLPPEATKAGPLCMDTYRWMFDCCRIPGLEGADWSVTYTQRNPEHIVVLRKGRVWKLDAWKDGKVLSVADIEKQLRFICENTEQDYPGVGVLTASHRDIWAKDYATLAADPHNLPILETIQSAAFVVCLDTDKPRNIIEHSQYLWHGSPNSSTGSSNSRRLGLHNRWVDKPVQFIVFDNGLAGVMGEHSVMDGTPMVNLCDVVLDKIADPSWDLGTPFVAGAEGVSWPQPLDFNVSEETSKAIKGAEKAAIELIEGQAMGLRKTSYGKATIKNFGVSPDSWAQMIVQLAYARLLRSRGEQREGGTYEAATTRKFFKGRTEAIRVVTSESDAWVKSMDDVKVGTEERRKLFGLAAKKHVALAKSAGDGQGVDRHMLGMSMLVEQNEELPTLYSDPVYKRAKTWVLSTSAIFSKHFQPYGWGEVVPNGFGVAYVTGFDDYLQYTITSRVEMPNEEFCEEIQRAAQDIYDLHASVLPKTLSSKL